MQTLLAAVGCRRLSEELGIVGRVTGGRTAYAHNIRRIGADHYRLSWSFDTKIAGSRLRWPRTITRDTDEAGALRFARKWGCSMPNVRAKGLAPNGGPND